jgi:hypothetical protein
MASSVSSEDNVKHGHDANHEAQLYNLQPYIPHAVPGQYERLPVT